MALCRIVRAMDTIPIMLAGKNFRQIHVPDVIGLFLERKAHGWFWIVGAIEQTEFHLGHFSEIARNLRLDRPNTAPNGNGYPATFA